MRGLAGTIAMLVLCTCSCAGPACTEYVVPSTTDLTTSASFRNDVLPVFTQSCAFSTCHGTEATSNQGLYLGAGTSPDPVKVRASLLAISATAGMPYVTPGDPKGSFVMRKLDGDQCMLDTTCLSRTCGARMPRNGAQLLQPQRDTVRRWIAQGAKDN
jgi:hypothetical protein